MQFCKKSLILKVVLKDFYFNHDFRNQKFARDLSSNKNIVSFSISFFQFYLFRTFEVTLGKTHKFGLLIRQ